MRERSGKLERGSPEWERSFPRQSIQDAEYAISGQFCNRARLIGMKPNNKLRLLAALCVALSSSPIAISAQTTPPTTTSTSVRDDRGTRDDHTDYGWVGLLGLIGLGGLMRKKDDHRHDTTAGRTDVRR